MNKTQFSQFKRDSFIYGIGSAFSKGLGLILLPVYTRLFNPIEYGLIEMLTITSVFLSIFLNMGMDSAQSFYFFKHKKEGGKRKQAQLVTAILQWRLTVGILITMLAIGISPLLNALLFNIKLEWTHFAVVFVGTLFFQISLQSAHIFQLLFRPYHFLCIPLFQSLSSATIAVGTIDQTPEK